MSSKDYLTEDSMLPKGQHFVCISFLSDPENKVTLSGIKVRGVFPTIDEASAHAKKLQSVDTIHNVFVGEMGKWLAFDPDATSEAAGNPEYANEQLNGIMKGYMDNQEKSKLFHEERKYKNMRESLEKSIETSNSTVDELKQKMLESKDNNEVDGLKVKLSNLDEQIKELTTKKNEIYKNEKKLGKKLGTPGAGANISV
jgi:hypothetical protein